jgi:hypothetical protein
LDRDPKANFRRWFSHETNTFHPLQTSAYSYGQIAADFSCGLEEAVAWPD